LHVLLTSTDLDEHAPLARDDRYLLDKARFADPCFAKYKETSPAALRHDSLERGTHPMEFQFTRYQGVFRPLAEVISCRPGIRRWVTSWRVPPRRAKGGKVGSPLSLLDPPLLQRSVERLDQPIEGLFAAMARFSALQVGESPWMDIGSSCELFNTQTRLIPQEPDLVP
jgi:hypothetical protein